MQRPALWETVSDPTVLFLYHSFCWFLSQPWKASDLFSMEGAECKLDIVDPTLPNERKLWNVCKQVDREELTEFQADLSSYSDHPEADLCSGKPNGAFCWVHNQDFCDFGREKSAFCGYTFSTTRGPEKHRTFQACLQGCKKWTKCTAFSFTNVTSSKDDVCFFTTSVRDYGPKLYYRLYLAIPGYISKEKASILGQEWVHAENNYLHGRLSTTLTKSRARYNWDESEEKADFFVLQRWFLHIQNHSWGQDLPTSNFSSENLWQLANSYKVR